MLSHWGVRRSHGKAVRDFTVHRRIWRETDATAILLLVTVTYIILVFFRKYEDKWKRK